MKKKPRLIKKERKDIRRVGVVMTKAERLDYQYAQYAHRMLTTPASKQRVVVPMTDGDIRVVPGSLEDDLIKYGWGVDWEADPSDGRHAIVDPCIEGPVYGREKLYGRRNKIR